MPNFERLAHVGAAVVTSLQAGIGSTDTTCTIVLDTGWPASGSNPFYVTLEKGTVKEEKILISNNSAGTLTISGRGMDGTTAQAHLAGASAQVCWTADEADEANQHYADTTVDNHCFSLDTDILAKDGWVRGEDISVGDEVWTFDIHTEQMKLEEVQAVLRYPAKDYPTLQSFSNQDFGELLVTDKHTMIHRRRGLATGNAWLRRDASLMPQQFDLPASGHSNAPELELSDEFIKLIAWSATEGHWKNSSTMQIAQKAGECADRIEELIQGRDYSVYLGRGNMKSFHVRDAYDIAYWLDEDKNLRSEFLQMSERQARMFIGECVLGDGHLSNVRRGDKLFEVEKWVKGDNTNLSMVLASVNGAFIDSLHGLCAISGIKSRVYPGADVYRLAIKSSLSHTGLRRKEVPNDQDVWCVSVADNKTVVVRRRDKSAAVITGNTQYLNTARHDITTRHTFGAALGTPTAATLSQPGDTAATGTGALAAREDHVHGREGSMVVATGAYTALAGQIVIVNNTGGFTITLPSPAVGATCRIINNGTGVLTLAAPGGLIYALGISGSSTISLAGDGSTLGLQSDGTNWLAVEGMPDTGWLTPTFTNGWGNGNGAGYRKVGNRVYMRGNMTAGTAGAAAFTLPAPYTPPIEAIFSTNTNATTSNQVTITAAGAVIPANSASTWLDGITFTVD